MGNKVVEECKQYLKDNGIDDLTSSEELIQLQEGFNILDSLSDK